MTALLYWLGWVFRPTGATPAVFAATTRICRWWMPLAACTA